MLHWCSVASGYVSGSPAGVLWTTWKLLLVCAVLCCAGGFSLIANSDLFFNMTGTQSTQCNVENNAHQRERTALCKVVKAGFKVWAHLEEVLFIFGVFLEQLCFLLLQLDLSPSLFDLWMKWPFCC